MDQALDVPAGLVHRQWDDEAVRRSLDDPVPIPVRWRPVRTPRLIDHPDNLTPGTEQLEPSSGDIPALIAANLDQCWPRSVQPIATGTPATAAIVRCTRWRLSRMCCSWVKRPPSPPRQGSAEP
ncbi:hypothetical protein GCM10010140_60820 [Streptosporangium pseudovulgare]|uniref:Uncharacterized protein n=1 Tax=Streptosporangium pseudovulgare TaxID=35765 RepID=A0ABQ2RDI2_9ACTN|nr:hypothetical protein GCM10010140_60820 [Streptosporangium pseudovulgare]